MNIGMFTDTWLPKADGVGTSLSFFKKELEARGNEVYVFAPGERNMEENGTVYYKSRATKAYPGFKMAFYTTPMHSRTKNFIRKHDIEILHLHTPGPMGLRAVLASRALDLPLIFTYHTWLPDLVIYAPSFLLSFPWSVYKNWHGAEDAIWSYTRWLFRRSDAIIAPTNVIKEELLNHCQKDEERKIFVVPTGVDLERFNPRADGASIRRSLGLENCKISIHVGRIAKEKRLETLIDAAPYIKREIPDCRFLIVGTGPMDAYYKNLVKERGLSESFIFTGYVPDSELPKYYAAADLFVFPSKFETQGLCALEAMACGVPVAASCYRALPEFVEDGKNGFLFDPDDNDSCVEAVIKGLNADERMKENAKNTAEKYSIKACTDRLLKVYEWVLREREADSSCLAEASEIV